MQKLSSTNPKWGIGKLVGYLGIGALCLTLLTGCPQPSTPNIAPTLQFDYGSTTYNAETTSLVELLLEAGSAFSLNKIISKDDVLVQVYKVNGGETALTDTDSSADRFEGSYKGNAPLTGVDEFDIVARDNESVETSIKVRVTAQDITPPGEDITPPGVPSNFTASAQGDGKIQYGWTEPSDNVGVTQYQLKVSLYKNIPNPNSPLDLGDISNVAGMPSPVSSGNSLDKLVDNLEPGVYYTGYLRAGDAANNWSDWVQVEVISGKTTPPNTPFELYGQIDGGSIPDGRDVMAEDKYINRVDTNLPPHSITQGGWYGLRILNRSTGILLKIICQGYTPTGSTTVKTGGTSERIDF